MDVSSFLCAFNKQLHISDPGQNTLSGFLHFLNNQPNASKTNVPYGLLVQYNDENIKDIFLRTLDSVLKELPSPNKYQLAWATEENFSRNSLAQAITSPEQIFVLTECSKQGDLEHIISEFEKNPGTIKIVCASSEIVEKRFKQNEHFFYRILPRHIYLEPLHSQEITERFLTSLRAKGYKLSEDFIKEIAYYIEAIYESADFQNEEFIADLIRRIELSMEEREGISAYKNKSVVDYSFIPYSTTVLAMKEAEVTHQPNPAGSPDSVVETKDSKNLEPKPEIVDQTIDVDTWFANITPASTVESDFPDSYDHTNVLLLALSTFGSFLKSTQYSCETAGITDQVDGYYQLEPVPKMLAKLLADGKEYLDKIVMLCTKETLNIATVKTPEGKVLTISPVEYFQRSVRSYLNPYSKNEDCFVTINVSLDSPYDGIQRVIEALRNINTPKLYLDTHGGIRGIQRIMEATVSLLKIEHINVEAAYAVEFGANPRIISETENMKIFDFVAGVNEFITCGRADTLKEYSNASCQEGSNSQEKELISAIQIVSNGIQWCCIPEFERGLSKLQTFFKDNNSSLNTSDQFSYLDIYKKDIERDYQKLVKKHNVADEINWCRKKGFYQQALTLIESKISTLLIDEWKILKINNKYTPACKQGKTLYKIPDLPKQVLVSSNDLFNGFVFPINKYILKNYHKTPGSDTSFLNYNQFNKLTKADYAHFLKSLQTDTRFSTAPDDIQYYLTKALENASTLSNGKKIDVKNCIIISDKTDQRILFKLLILHKTLKDVRNTMNHASSEQKYDLDSIVLALEYYMKWIKQLNPNIKLQPNSHSPAAL